MSDASHHASSKNLNSEFLGNEAVAPDLSALSSTRTTVLPLRSARVIQIACCALIFVATFLPRGLQLDRLVTVDEPLLLGWSANLVQGIGHGNLGDIADAYGYTYPGVTVVWLGAIGYLIGDPSYAWEVDEQLEIPNSDIEPTLLDRGKQPLDILVRARTIEIIANAVVLVLALLVAIRILGLAVSMFGFLLIAFDPFNIAHTRLLNVNGLDGNLMLLSLLAFIAYLEDGKKRRDLALSGVAAGLACLTKLPAIFIVPFVALIVGIRVIQRWRTSGALQARYIYDEGKPLLVWGAFGALTFIALWPAMWVHPIRTVKIFETVFFTGSEGHGLQTYFNGKVSTDDPGLLFYPLTFLWRSTPVVLAGLCLVIIVVMAPLFRRRHFRVPPTPVLYLVLFAALYGTYVSVAAKKFDRYLLPSFAPLAIVAAWGWLESTRLLLGARDHVARYAIPAVICVAVLAQAGTALASSPYYLSYFNPLFGGGEKAQADMMIGWGEGFDQIADFVNSQPDAETLVVTSGPWGPPMSYLLVGRSIQTPNPEHWMDGPTGIVQVPSRDLLPVWAKSDYFAVYINQEQRQLLPPELVAYLGPLEPVKIVRIDGIEYARLYDIRTAGVPPSLLDTSPNVSDWGGRVRFLTAVTRTAPVLRDETTRIEVYFTPLDEDAVASGDVELSYRVINQDGDILSQGTDPIEQQEVPRSIWRTYGRIEVPVDAVPGEYQVEIRFVDRDSGETLQGTFDKSGEPVGDWLELGTLEISPDVYVDED